MWFTISFTFHYVRNVKLVLLAWYGHFQYGFLAAAYGITVIETATLDCIDFGFQNDRIPKFRASVCQYVLKQRNEPEGSNMLFQMVKYKSYRAFGTEVHQECKK